MSEGMRTGASRGLSSSSQQQLREAYGAPVQRRRSAVPCSSCRPAGAARDLRDQEAKTARLEQDREKLTREQCAEMLRIAQGKRQRLDAMTAGERADFDRFDGGAGAEGPAGSPQASGGSTAGGACSGCAPTTPSACRAAISEAV
jgi:hypothetical protein